MSEPISRVRLVDLTSKIAKVSLGNTIKIIRAMDLVLDYLENQKVDHDASVFVTWATEEERELCEEEYLDLQEYVAQNKSKENIIENIRHSVY